MRKTIIGAALLLMTGAAAAESDAVYDVNHVLAAFDMADHAHQRNLLQVIVGQEQVLIFANAYLVAKHREPLFCIPEDLTLTGVQIMDLMRQAARNDPRIGNMPLAMGVMISIINTYPCTGAR